jgi:hypothetical protein
LSLRTRLQRLERKAADHDRGQVPREDVFTRIRRFEAYFRGEGPRPEDPPCPPSYDPAEWASRMRIGRCLEYRMTGELPNDGYLPDMTAEERKHMDLDAALASGAATSNELEAS